MLSLLGKGGMGEVYDALDPELGRHVALKILPPLLVADRRRLDRFVQEARSASALNHPNVVSIYEIGHQDDIHFIAMEKIEGTTLRAMLAGARLPARSAVEIVAQVAEGIAAAHAAGVVHRDLKPENVMLATGGYAKILDFGLAKLRGGDELWNSGAITAAQPTESGVILGTAGYMSPEQAQGKPVDQRTDIFALGCILYEALAGRRAFTAPSPVETLHKIVNVDAEPLSGSAPELQRIVRKAMAKDPEARYQSAREMALDLRAFGREIERVPRRHQHAVVAAAAVIAVIAALFVVAVRRQLARPAVFPALSVQRVTARGTVVWAALSPDGKYIAYQLLGGTLWLRQLASGQEIELVREQNLWGMTFTPDGNQLVYAVRGGGKPAGAFYRIPIIGGHAEHLVDGVVSAPTFSPDGKQMAWLRDEFPHRGESALMIGNSDGSGARPLAVHRLPERVAPISFGGPSWSADGALIATSVCRSQYPVACKLVGIDPRSGAERTLFDWKWPRITQSAWLPDGSGIIAAARSESDDSTQQHLWRISIPDGTASLLTRDIFAYRGVSISADGKSLLTVALDASAQIWSVPLDGSSPPRKISTGRFDGWSGLTITPSGGVVFSTTEENKFGLYAMDADGGGRTRLKWDQFDNGFPAAFKGGIVYISGDGRMHDVCVTSFEGEGRRVLVHGVDSAAPAVSPDGTWVAFRREGRLWKMPMNGGAAIPLVSDVSSNAAWSPAGDRIAFIFGDPQNFAGRLGIIAASDGRLLWSSPMLRLYPAAAIRWMPDGSGLVINGGITDDRNLWLIPLAGQPRRLTDFNDQSALAWDLTPDGKRAVISRAAIYRDAALFTGLR